MRNIQQTELHTSTLALEDVSGTCGNASEIFQERCACGRQRYDPSPIRRPNEQQQCTDIVSDAYKQLVASLTRIVTQYPPAEVRAGGGLYTGPTSIAYLFLILQQQYADLAIEDHQLGTWSAAYLKQAQDHIKSFPGPRVGKCGIMDDILALLAIGAASSKDADMAAELCDYVAEAVDPESENEWLYGRAGYLYFLRLVKASFIDDERTSRLLKDTAAEVVETILESPRPWKWHGKAYVGAVHGAFGIITQIVLTDPDRYAPKVEAELAVLLSYQYEGGNWPSSIPPGKDRLVQVCHGAPGVVNCLVSIRHYFPNLHDRIDASIKRARECIWERGLLTKEPCLCHGMPRQDRSCLTHANAVSRYHG